MPSTYTDSLGLELQATGENPSTWGTKANTVFSLIEEATSGYAAVAVSGDTTLTITDGTASSGATDQARNAFIKLTGSPGAAFALTMPEVAKTWLLWNATDSAATVKTATATATVTLPAGQLVAVQSDGAGSALQVTPFVTDEGKVPLSYIENMGATTISETQWGYVGEADQPVKTTDSPEFAGLTVASLAYPSSDGTSGQYVKTDGAGKLSFGTPAGAGDVLAAANGSDFDDAPTVLLNIGALPVAGGVMTGDVDFGGNGLTNLGSLSGGVLAAQVEAEDGTDNTKLMTPLRTAQAIESLAAPGLTLVSTQTVGSPVAAVDFTTGIDGAFDEYVLTILNCVPSAASSQLFLRTSSNGGSTFDSNGSDYHWQLLYANSSAVGGNAATGDGQIDLSYVGVHPSANASYGGLSGSVTIIRPASTGEHTGIAYSTGYTSDGSNNICVQGYGRRISTAAVDAVRILPSSGNISSGVFKLYGVKK